MKYFTFFLILIGTYTCEKPEVEDPFFPNNPEIDNTDNPDLIGNWLVTESYIDPGTGNGDYEPVDSDRQLRFTAEGEVSSNQDLCNMFSDVSQLSSGTYDLADGTIDPENCSAGFNPIIGFEIEGKVMTVEYFCDEGCGLRLRKLR